MEQLIFFAVLIFFSIIESIARTRKQRRGGGQLPRTPDERPSGWDVERPDLPTPRPTPRPRPRMSDVPSYDDDRSFDAEPSFDELASSEEERRKRAASSESMIPPDIWEEIKVIAREATVELPTPRPKPQPRLPAPSPQQRRAPQPKAPAPKPPQRQRPMAPQPAKPTAPARPPALEGTPTHVVHLSHAGYGTDPSERARSEQDVLRPIDRAIHADASAVRRQLRGRGVHALRQALILQEVLGPPAASKPDRFSE